MAYLYYSNDITQPEYAIDGNPYTTDPSNSYYKKNIFDDNQYTTYIWASKNDTNPCWLGQDFGVGNEKHIRKMVITQNIYGYNSMSNINIESSQDGVSWNLILNVTDLRNEINTILLPESAPARFWRIWSPTSKPIDQHDSAKGWVLFEFEMMEGLESYNGIYFDSSIDMTKGSAGISSYFGQGYASNPFDNDLETGYSTDFFTEGKQLYVGQNFGNSTVRHIRYLTILQGDPNLTDQQYRTISTVDVQSSMDGTSWATIASIDLNYRPFNSIALPESSPAQYWRLLATSTPLDQSSNTTNRWRLTEIQMSESLGLPPLFTMNPLNKKIYKGNTVTITVTVPTDYTISSYEWIYDSSVFDLVSSSMTEIKLKAKSDVASGYYPVQYQMTNSVNDSFGDTAVILVCDNLSITLSPYNQEVHTWEQNEFTVTSEVNNPLSSFNWEVQYSSDGSVFTPMINQAEILSSDAHTISLRFGSIPGMFRVRYSATDNFDQTSSRVLDVKVLTRRPITVDINENQTSIKQTKEFTLSAQAASDAAITSWKWTPDPAGVPEVIAESQTNITMKFQNVGTYTVTYEATNEDGSTASETVSVTVIPLDTMTVTLDQTNLTIYRTESVTMTVSPATNGSISSYSWVYDTAHISPEIPVSQTQAQLKFNEIGTYTVRYEVTNTDGVMAYAECMVTVKARPIKVTLNPSSLTVKVGHSFDIQSTITSGAPLASFAWGTPDLAIIEKEELNKLTLSFSSIGDYRISFAATNVDGKTDIIEVHIQVILAVDFTAATPSISQYPLPTLVKRNARYRGPRESSKHLYAQEEKRMDLLSLYQQTSQREEQQKAYIKDWFYGSEESSVLVIYHDEKSFRIALNQVSFSLIESHHTGVFSDVMVKLNGTLVPSIDYHLIGNSLVLNQPTSGDLVVSFNVEIMVDQEKVRGVSEIERKMRQLDDRLGELERRYQAYANADI